MVISGKIASQVSSVVTLTVRELGWGRKCSHSSDVLWNSQPWSWSLFGGKLVSWLTSLPSNLPLTPPRPNLKQDSLPAIFDTFHFLVLTCNIQRVAGESLWPSHSGSIPWVYGLSLLMCFPGSFEEGWGVLMAFLNGINVKKPLRGGSSFPMERNVMFRRGLKII